MLDDYSDDPLCLTDLEDRFGQDGAYVILRTLEKFEGVREEWVSGMSREARLNNVLRLMGESVLHQTRH
jgi:hypothetical protein